MGARREFRDRQFGLWLMFFLLGLVLPLTASARAAVSPRHLVFAHYMVTNTPGSAGNQVSPEDYKKEIVYAQAHGIDGFVLDCADWQTRNRSYKNRSEMIYQAAQELGTGFKLMMSVDYCCNISNDDVRDMVVSFYHHPNQFRVNGVPVLTTFGSLKRAGDMNDLVGSLKAQGMPILLVPSIQPHSEDPDSPLSPGQVTALMQANPFMDGDFYFAAAATSDQATQETAIYAKELHATGKVFIVGIAPFYRGFRNNYRVVETQGFARMQAGWKAAIENDADFVEIVTWNDWAEGTYVSPFMPQNNRRTGPLTSHEGYLDASRYYIDWYKSGTPPPITTDRLFYFYRPQPKSVPGQIDPSGQSATTGVGRPRDADTLHDSVFVTLFLTAPADLTIHSGDSSHTFHVEAGAQNVEMPFSPGDQRLILVRDDKVIIDKTAERQISPSDNSTDFNYFSGGASAGSSQ